MGVSALQCGRLASGRRGRPWAEQRVQPSFLEDVPESGQGSKPGCTDFGGALRGSDFMAEGGRVGQCDEL